MLEVDYFARSILMLTRVVSGSSSRGSDKRISNHKSLKRNKYKDNKKVNKKLLSITVKSSRILQTSVEHLQIW